MDFSADANVAIGSGGNDRDVVLLVVNVNHVLDVLVDVIRKALIANL